MIYARAFFDLQFQFAETVSALSGKPLAQTLLDYTNLYIRFAIGRHFDAAHPVWQEYVAGLRHTQDGRAWTHRFYMSRSHAASGPEIVAAFGCFGYAPLGPGRIRLHFENVETNDISPLAAERRAQRLVELGALFAHIKRTVPGPPGVVGASWLYNLEAYRRLFPKSYLATARPLHDRFQRMPLWGQFLSRRGDVKESLAREFLERLGRQSSLEGLDRCFPFQALGLEAPATEFYQFYGV